MTRPRFESAMWKRLFDMRRNSSATLQAQLREVIVHAVLGRTIPAGGWLPSSRALAEILHVSRNTVTIAYEALVDNGVLVSTPRLGYRVSPKLLHEAHDAPAAPPRRFGRPPDWATRLVDAPSCLPSVSKPLNWQDYAFPFVYGQFDASLFPVTAWREVNQLAQRTMSVREWAGDRVDTDDAMLVEQIQQRLLPRRGIWVSPDQILVTVGAQHAAYLIASLLLGPSCVVGAEEPGYPDIRNICSRFGARIEMLPLDKFGLTSIDSAVGCDYVYVSPSHQNPTGATMPLARREALLEAAAEQDFVIIEDDYDSELVYEGAATPAIKALDRDDRVIYIGSLSKTIAPGLRMGYMVGPTEFIKEARAMRRLMMRHPPTNNQRALALFLSLGHHEALIRKLILVYRARAQVLVDSLRDHLPNMSFVPPRGGSSLWLNAPPEVDMSRIAMRARTRGILFDAGETFFSRTPPPKSYFRLGYSSMPTVRIAEGIRVLSQVIGAGDRGFGEPCRDPAAVSPAYREVGWKN
ncbi:GntR family transcriptional regulator/MocR family aminotransferase [Paraburkholderia sp. GAS448]|uniref:MocR-like pyridoxine biosynthesis transcription factor PdxR n=1 Tax=Paraburkholderia sp. GAS448 TaxID=3035136 RepID=UPI003D1B84B0